MYGLPAGKWSNGRGIAPVSEIDRFCAEFFEDPFPALPLLGLERGRPNTLPTMTAMDFRSLAIIHIVDRAF